MSRPRIAIIGAGAAGLGAAYALKDAADIEVWEARGRAGGHANTVMIDYDGVDIAVDTGFIVFNDGNYPNLIALFEALGVASFRSDMSFGFACPRPDGRPGLEWSSNADGLFAQARNLASPRFLGMLGEVLRFNRRARADLALGRLGEETLEAYLDRHRFGAAFRAQYLLPMGAAIWSSTPEAMAAQPAASVIRFFDNHRLMHATRRQWRTVEGGSQAYVRAIADALGPRLMAGRKAVSVSRAGARPVVCDAEGGRVAFDEVILACHSDQALALLEDAADDERAMLSAIRYAPNRAVLHRDPIVRPRAPRAQAAWNYRVDPAGGPAQVTYDMNRLQGVDAARPLYVTLNPHQAFDPALVFSEHDYDHPQFDSAAAAAQRRFNTVQGVRRTWFAGAWLGYGFHEDALRAGLRVALRLGGRIPWRFVEGDVDGGPWGARPEDAPALEPAGAAAA